MIGASKGLLLLAEDDPDQSELLIELLSGEGYQVMHAENSLQVVRLLAERPDVILLDLIGVSSPAVFHALAIMRAPPAMVLVSSDPRLSDVANELSAEAYLSKPYRVTDLVQTVKSCVEGRRIAQAVLAESYA